MSKTHDTEPRLSWWTPELETPGLSAAATVQIEFPPTPDKVALAITSKISRLLHQERQELGDSATAEVIEGALYDGNQIIQQANSPADWLDGILETEAVRNLINAAKDAVRNPSPAKPEDREVLIEHAQETTLQDMLQGLEF